MRVFPREASEKRCHQSGKSVDRIIPECAEEQVEPHHVGMEFAQMGEQAKGAVRTVGRPAAYHREAMEFRRVGRDFVTEDGQLDKGIALKFLSDMKSIFTQASMARRKGSYQTDSHSASRGAWFLMRPLDRMLARFAAHA